MKKYVLTGGPGIGKTTVIELLAARGYKVVPEAARTVIEEEQFRGSDVLPWGNLGAFQERVAELQLINEEKIVEKEVFMDRGLIDGYTYCRYGNVPVPTAVEEYGRGRYDKVFYLAQLGEYEMDNERKESSEFADTIHRMMRESYESFGYTPIDVPVLPPEERVDFILAALSK